MRTTYFEAKHYLAEGMLLAASLAFKYARDQCDELLKRNDFGPQGREVISNYRTRSIEYASSM